MTPAILSPFDPIIQMVKSAEFSPCGKYRFRLERIWNSRLPRCPWGCLNPSIANAEIDDPTVRKITGFTARWGYGGFVLFNVMALRATDPRDLLRDPDPRGSGNEPWRIAQWCAAVSPDAPVLAWGAIHKRLRPFAIEVLAAIPDARCLGYTQGGDPRHPLMLPYATPLETFRR